MGAYYYFWNQSRDVYLFLGKKSLYDMQDDIKNALSAGWSLDESWYIVDDEETVIDPLKVLNSR